MKIDRKLRTELVGYSFEFGVLTYVAPSKSKSVSASVITIPRHTVLAKLGAELFWIRKFGIYLADFEKKSILFTE